MVKKSGVLFLSQRGGDRQHSLQTNRLGTAASSGAREPDRQYDGTASHRGTSCLSSDASAGSGAPVGDSRDVRQAGLGGRTSAVEGQGPVPGNGCAGVNNRAAGLFQPRDLENNLTCAPAVVAPRDSGEERCCGRDRQRERREKTRTRASKMKSDDESLAERDDGNATDPSEEVYKELRYGKTGGTAKEEATTALAGYQDSQKDLSRGRTEGGEFAGLYGSTEDTLPCVHPAVGDSTSPLPLLIPSTSSSATKRQMCSNPVIVARDGHMEDQEEDGENAEEVQNASVVHSGQPGHLPMCEPFEPSSVAPPALWEGGNAGATCLAPLRREGTGHRDEPPHSARRTHRHHHRPSWGHHYPPTETEAAGESPKLCTVKVAPVEHRGQSGEDKELRRPSFGHHEGLFKGVAQFARKWVKKHLHSTHGDERQSVPFAVSSNGHSRSALPSENRSNYPMGLRSATHVMTNEPGRTSRASPRDDGGWAHNSGGIYLDQDTKEQETGDKQKDPSLAGEGRGLLCSDPSACVPLAAGSLDLLQFGDAEDYFAYHSLEQKSDDFHHPSAVTRAPDYPLRQQEREEAREDTMTVAITESVREGRYHQRGERRARFSDDMPQHAEGGKVTPEYGPSPGHPPNVETAKRRGPQSSDVRRNEEEPVSKTSADEGKSDYRETGSPVARRTGRGQEKYEGDDREAFGVATEKDCGILGTSSPLCVICAASLTSPNESLYSGHQNDHPTEEPFCQSFLDRFIFPYFLPRFTPQDASFGALLPPRDPPFTPSCSCWYAKHVSCASSTRECSLDVLPACRAAVSDGWSLQKTSAGERQGPSDSASGFPLPDRSTTEKSYLVRRNPFAGSSSALPDSGGRKGRKAAFLWGFRRKKNHRTVPGPPCELHVFRPAPFDTPSSCAACLEALLILLTNRRPPPEVAAFVFSNFSSKVFPASVPLQSLEGPPSVLPASLFCRPSCSEPNGGGEGIDTPAACRFAMLSDANQVADGLSVSAVNASFDTVPPDVSPPSPSGGSSLPGGELLTLYKDFRASASRFLVKLWRWVVLGEKVCNLFSWKNRGITQIATILFAGMVLVLLAVPLQYILVLWVVHAFIAGQKRGLWNLLSRQCACRHVEAAIYQIVSAERASSYRRRQGTSPPSSNKKRPASTASLRAGYGGSDSRGFADGVRPPKQTELCDGRHSDAPALLRFLTVPQLHQLQWSLWRRCRVWLSLDTLWEALDEAQVGEAVRRGRTETTVSTSRWARPDWMTNLLMHAPTDVTHQPAAILLRDSRSLFAGGELLPSESDALNLAADAPGVAAVESWEGTTVTGAEETRPRLDPATQGEDDARETDGSDEPTQ